jgi:hypothetical protein
VTSPLSLLAKLDGVIRGQAALVSVTGQFIMARLSASPAEAHHGGGDAWSQDDGEQDNEGDDRR